MRRVLFACSVAWGLVASGEDLAWKFDTTARTADVVATSDAAANAEASDLRGPVASAASQPIAYFDSRWQYAAGFGYFLYRYYPGLFFSVR